MSDVLLPRRGTLVSWTTQGFPPGLPYKGPTGKDFVPFGVGLVQLDDVIRVEGPCVSGLIDGFCHSWLREGGRKLVRLKGAECLDVFEEPRKSQSVETT